HTVGCGGGSIAWADRGGALRVGPHSAGADPGPACYGRGDEPTVTDAHVALGHIGPRTLLGGALEVDARRAVVAIERLAGRPGRLAAVTPDAPAAFAAIGPARAGGSVDLVETLFDRVDRTTAPGLVRRARALEQAAVARLEPGPGRARASSEFLLRYRGQGAGLWLRARTGLLAAFAARHAALFGFVPAAPVEVVALRARAEREGTRLPEAAPPDAAGGPVRRRAPLGGS